MWSSLKQALRAPIVLVAVLALSAGWSLSARADTETHSATGHERPEASLQARVHQEVAQDRLRITMQVQLSDASQSALATSLNQHLSKALDTAKAKAGEDIRVQSGSYQIWPATDDKGSITNWRGKGDIHLESADFDAVSELAGELGPDMVIAGLNFFVSPEKRAKVENDLLENAIGQFRERAQRVAEAFGYASYELHQVDLGGGDHYAPTTALRAADSSVAMSQAMRFEGGTETISLTVQGSVYLSRSKQ